MMAQQTILTGRMVVRAHRLILFVALSLMFQIRMRMYDDPAVREDMRMGKNGLVNIGQENQHPRREEGIALDMLFHAHLLPAKLITLA